MKTLLRVLRWLLILAVLGFTAYNGILEGTIAIRTGVTLGQRIATATQLAYGALAVLALLSLPFMRRWAYPLLKWWALMVVITLILAPAVWAAASLGTNLIVAAIGLILTGLVLWSWRRENTVPPIVSR
jgi:hypothetical protein